MMHFNYFGDDEAEKHFYITETKTKVTFFPRSSSPIN